MKIGKRLVFLILFAAAVFTAAIFLQRHLELKRLRILFADKKQESIRNFAKIVGLKNKKLESYVIETTYWDELVKAVEANDQAWFRASVEPSFIGGGNYNAVWVFNNDKAPVYSFNSFNEQVLRKFPLTTGALDTLLKQNIACHFFIQTTSGIMEVVGARIYPGSDPERKTPPRGYFFAGKLWDADYLKEISELTASSFSVVTPSDADEGSRDNFRQGMISFIHTLPAWDGSPLVFLRVNTVFSQIKNFNKTLNRGFALLIIFMGMITATIMFFVVKWIAKPLVMISKTLKKDDASYVRPLLNNASELGEVARLINDFFEQRKDLVKEISGRRESEEKLKATQSQLIQSSKMASMGLLAGGVAHEINNPLTGVLNNVQLVKLLIEQGRAVDFTEIKSILNAIEESALRCRNITKSLLDFSHASKGVYEPLSIDDMVDKVLLLIEHELRLQNINVHKELRLGIPLLRGERQLIQQVILDVISNARWAIGKKGHKKDGLITIKTHYDAGTAMVCLSIADNGIGIEKGNIPRLFEPFFTTKDIGEGTGLGLSIVYNIMQSHKGRVEVESEPGQGATFNLFFPAVP